MRILGIDYGKKKIGLSIAYSPIAEPHKVVRFKSEEEALEKVSEVLKASPAKSPSGIQAGKQVDLIVVGVSEGKMGKESRKFGNKLEEKLKIPVVFQDETLTTREAQELSRKAGVRRKKRRGLEDAYSATLILQRYLDN